MTRPTIARIVDNLLIHHDPFGNALPSLLVGTDDWYVWLAANETHSFTYRTPYGAMTARREQRHQRQYWYAYFLQGTKLRKLYLGKSEELTEQRLNDAARKLAEQHAPEARALRQKPATPVILLKSKLLAPAPPPVLVPRPHLLQWLQHSTTRALTLLCAPAGSGKTTLLSSWVASCQPTAAWLSLHRTENDPVTFLTYLLEALRTLPQREPVTLSSGQQAPEFGADLVSQFADQRQQLSVMTKLINELDVLPEQSIIVLDSYEVIHNQAIHDALAFLLDHLPAHIHLVIASRSEPPFPLARLYVSGQVRDLRSQALCFSHEEILALLADTLPQPLDADEIAFLEQHTGGWIAGLQLALLTLQEQGQSWKAAFRGSNRHVQAYFIEEVLKPQSAEMQTFLLSTALLESFSSSLCQAVVEHEQARTLLEQAERTNLFLLPLDGQKGWYRYHSLFAEVLRDHAERLYPELIPLVHRRASRWFIEHDRQEDAIEQSLAAHDIPYAATLIEQSIDTLLGNGEIRKLESWLAVLPVQTLRSSPRLCIASAWVYQLTTQRTQVFLSWLNAAEQAVVAAEERLQQEMIAALRGEIVALRALHTIAYGDFSQAIEACRQALGQLVQGSLYSLYARSMLLLSMGIAYQRGKNVAMAAQVLAEASSSSQASGHSLLASYVMASQSELYWTQGYPSQAIQLCQQILKRANGRAEHPEGIAYIRLGYLFWDWNSLDTARQYLLQAWDVGMRSNNTNVIVASAFLLALVSQAQGLAQEARYWSQQLDDVAQDLGLLDLFASAAALRAKLSLEQGRLEEAMRWAQERAACLEDEAKLQEESECLLLVEVFMVADRHYIDPSYLQRAMKMLERLRLMAESVGRTRLLVKVLALQALMLSQRGDQAGALSTLERSIELAEPGRYIRLFVESDDSMAKLLRQLLERYRTQKTNRQVSTLMYLRRLLAAFSQTASPVESGPLAQGQPLFDPLSWREREVLRLMAAGWKNQEIADKLVVVTGTVKVHINNIYRKLAVNSRIQAIERARELQLL